MGIWLWCAQCCCRCCWDPSVGDCPSTYLRSMSLGIKLPGHGGSSGSPPAHCVNLTSKAQYPLTVPPAMRGACICPTSCPTWYLQSFISVPVMELSFNLHFPRWSWAQIPFRYWPFAHHLLCSTYSSTLPFISFLLGLSFFFLICGSILDTRPLSDTCVARTSTRSAVILLSYQCLWMNRCCISVESGLPVLCFMVHTFCVLLKK